jgi:tRNA-2-methylthio-N6-dimethylallyladenosine synthase
MQAVHFDGGPELAGQIIDVRIVGASLNSLTGQLPMAQESAA